MMSELHILLFPWASRLCSVVQRSRTCHGFLWCKNLTIPNPAIRLALDAGFGLLYLKAVV